MRADLETLYDAHAHRLYAHCWSLVGDRGAAGALRETLTEASRIPPRGETVLWLHGLARAVCSERGAFGRQGRPVFAQAAADPLLDAVANLPAGHREALLLSAGEWLEVRDIAAVLRCSPGTVRELLHEARTGLERVVLDALMRGAADPARHMDVIEAFERGRLPNLLARRAPAMAPAPLRDQVLAAADREEIGHAEPAVPAGEVVVIGSAGDEDPRRERSRRRRSALKGVGGVAGVAASVAAGLVMTWPSAGDGTVNALGPSNGGTRPGPAPVGNITDDPGTPERPGGEPDGTAPAATPTTAARAPVADEPAGSGGGSTGPAKPREEPAPSTPSVREPDSRQTASAPPQESPEQQPPDGGSSPDGPLKPVTDLVGHLTSPLLGGLAGRQGG
ncbi:sigma factor-like helix-turn-helix DNA-binding protein [Actinomadura rugatobispora]|uniref:Sigma factor-like helix-turn-helix DNA-binding protein n=1 Tax=Actinomadura rugatobispora TaxID=1994 RepID=A0ABW1AIC3_9ACTN|nr:hypothetical protein GCM10010200_022630 [Actinomadura rugatobispora]